MRLAISLCYHRATIMVQVHSVPHSLYGGKPANLSKFGRNFHGSEADWQFIRQNFPQERFNA